ncbi:sensor histidine kinase [Sphingobacterium sp. Mn56C]|uniref:sensor histidine kinase n=1 Tax=Sphingobacterium sp. Mn56C TaxID=3395261 RepID=UPI003BD6113D
MENKTRLFLGLHLLLIIAVAFCTLQFAVMSMYYVAVLFFILLLALFLALNVALMKPFKQMQKIALALIHGDYSIDFSTDLRDSPIKDLHVLYTHIQKKEQDRASEKFLYDQLLNSMESGLVMLQLPEGEGDKKLFFMNQYFKDFFAIPAVSSWNFLQQKLPNFCAIFADKNFAEFKEAWEIQLDKGEKQTFLIQTAIANVGGTMYYTIIMDSIQRLINRKQDEAWMDVMKVMSHELMNSLTPIHTLAATMEEILQQDRLSEEDKDDLRIGIKTIRNSSNHLQDFVTRYRQLTMLPSPQKSTLDIIPLIQDVLYSYQAVFEKEGIQVTFVNDRQSLPIQGDVGQLSQVFINLLSNSIYALKTEDKKSIQVRVKAENQRYTLAFVDSAKRIDPQIVAKIFLPFYTTRKEGAGIGLALSKAIMEGHGGYLYYQESDESNCFMVVFVL